MKELTDLLAKLATSLGVTVDKLWDVLLKQAPISGTIDLINCIVLIITSVFLCIFVKNKTTIHNGEVYTDWEDVGCFLSWTGLFIFIVSTVCFVMFSIEGIVAAFYNPEYWALSKILSNIQNIK